MTEASSKALGVANRIKMAREIACHSRRRFAKASGIPNTTLKHWEDKGTKDIPESSITKLLKGLLIFGIHCSYDWIMKGEGNSPIFIKPTSTPQPFGQAKRLNKVSLVIDKHAEEELALFSKHSNNVVSFVVPDDAMEPRFIPGEVVAGICYYDDKEIAQLLGHDCIVSIEGGSICLRTILKGDIKGCYHLIHTNSATSINNPSIHNAVLISATPVIWQRRLPVL